MTTLKVQERRRWKTRPSGGVSVEEGEDDIEQDVASEGQQPSLLLKVCVCVQVCVFA